jgi:oligopeptidase B
MPTPVEPVETPPEAPPEAPRRPYDHTEHGVTRPDPYHWMRDVGSPELVSHLVAERAWYDATTGHLGPLIDSLRAEMATRVPLTDWSVRWAHGSFSYYTQVPAGRDYPQLLRDLNTESADPAPESSGNGDDRHDSPREPQIVLDGNALAEGADHFELGLTRLSPDDRLLAFSVDVVGDEVYTLRFRDLATGADLPDEVARTYYGGAWSADARHFFYTVHDEAYRPFQVWRHELGTSVDRDVLVLEEPDEKYEVLVRGTRSGGLVVIWAGCRDTTEVWVVDAHDPTGPARSVGGRRKGVEYHAEHVVHPDGGEELLLVTNDGATEYRLASAPVPRTADQDHTAWSPVRPEDPAERLERVDAFAGHVVLTLRRDGVRRLRVLPLGDLAGTGADVEPALPGGMIGLAVNTVFDPGSVTVLEQSLVHPLLWSDVDLATGARTERHRQEAPGHDPSHYVCERRAYPAPDGTMVPATVVRRRDVPLDGTAPALLYGYGAYEYSFEPEWDPALPSLLDHGVVYVHAHVRGGGEGGRRWWLDGRMEHKQNTFTDHAAVADGVAGDSGTAAIVDGSRLATRGLSAGGLLQGAVLSQRPERWRAVVAEVPFVDVVTSMLDPSIPLTINEWDEWGDPRREADFRWMLAYSPYDNLPAAGSRPDLLVTGALHDARVMVWEPAKWVAALRHSDPAWSPRCLFRVETGAGAHAGPSGRFGHLAYEAEVYAWVLDKLAASHG